MTWRTIGAWTGLVAVAAVGAVAITSRPADAADHTEPPRVGTEGDAAADIADFYAWHRDVGGSTKLVLAITFAGLAAPGEAATYDPDVLYGVHIDNDGDAESDVDLWVRFGQDGAGEWGVQLVGAPGLDGPLEGAVESEIEEGDVKVFAGLRDDPFFFDLDGFTTTLSTGDLAFDSTNDTFAGANVTAIVIELDADGVLAEGETALQTWATTARIGGGA